MSIKYALVQLHKNRGDKTFYIRKYDNQTKKITYVCCQTTDVTKANQWLSNEIANEGKEESEHTLRDAFNAHLNTPLSPKTKTNIVQSMSYVKSLLNTPLTALKGYQFADLVVPLKLAESTKKTLNRVYHGVLQTAIRRCWLEKNPLDGIRFYSKSSPKKPEFWTPNEVDAIVELLPAKFKVLGGLLAYQGLRMGEAVGFRKEHIVNGKLQLKGKTGFSEMPLSGKFENILEHYDVNSKIRKSTFKDALNKACKELGLNGRAFPHKFRHSFISNLLLKGTPIQVASKLARHNKPTTTLAYYSHCLPNDMERYLNNL